MKKTVLEIKTLKITGTKGFSLLAGVNRPVIPQHVTKLAASIEAMGVIRPVVVARFDFLDGVMNTYIIDGQHLYHALMRMGWDIPYTEVVIKDNLDLAEHLALLNSSSKSWTMKDYITVWANVNKDYVKLNKYFNTYDIELMQLAEILMNNYCMNSGFSSSISKERSAAANFSEQYEEAKAMSVNNSKGLLESMSRNVGQSRGWQVSESSRYADSISKTAQFTNSLQEDKGYSAKQAAEISLSLGGKIFGFGAGSNFSSQGSYDEAVKEGKSLAESQGVTKHLEVGTSHLKDVRYNEGSGEDKKLTENLETSLNQMERYSNIHRAAINLLLVEQL